MSLAVRRNRLERKDSTGNNARPELEILTELNQAFTAFKEKSEADFKGLDGVRKAEIKTINDRIDALSDELKTAVLEAKRVKPSNDNKEDPHAELKAQYAQLMGRYYRLDFSVKSELRDVERKLIEAKALSNVSNPDGGYRISWDMDAEVGRIVTSISPMRQIARVRSTQRFEYVKRTRTEGFESGWEDTSPTDTDTGKISRMIYPVNKLWAYPGVDEDHLEDADYDVEAEIRDETAIAFAAKESEAFINGSGVKQPQGLLKYPTVADASWAWGKVGFISTGVNGDFPSTNPGDGAAILIDLAYSLKSELRQNARWLMNRKTFAEVRKLRDDNGNFLWQPSVQSGLQAGQPISLLGFPVVEDEYMPDFDTTGNFAIAFGDFNRGYVVIDRRETRILRDPFNTLGMIKYYITKRVGGGIDNFEAIKLLKFSA